MNLFALLRKGGKRQKQLRWLTLGLAAYAGVVGLYPENAEANVSASLVASLPISSQTQVFPKGIAPIAPVAAQSTTVKKTIPKKKPAPKVVRTLKVSATAYNSLAAQTDPTPFIAADGTRTYWGMIAMNCVPFGTKVRIPSMYGSKVFKVHDRGGFGCNHVDVWMQHYGDARKFGRRALTIEIVQ